MVADNGAGDGVIFAMYSNGVVSSRDAWVYNFSASKLASNMRRMVGVYNRELQRYIEAVDALGAAAILNLLAFLTGDNTQISWSRGSEELYPSAARGARLTKPRLSPCSIALFVLSICITTECLTKFLMRSNILFGEEHDNRAICVNGTGGFDWSVLAVSRMPDLNQRGVRGRSAFRSIIGRTAKNAKTSRTVRWKKFRAALQRQAHRQNGYFPLCLCRPSSSRLSGAVQGQLNARIAAHPVRARLFAPSPPSAKS